MARPNKTGLDYFSLDVKMDDEVELIKAQHGMEGFGILISMYQTIYSDKGYYKKWNERNQILFSNKVSTDRKIVASIIDDCIKWDIFDKNLYEKYNILTSKRIQKQYVNATYKRSEVELMREYLLLKEKDIDRENITCNSVSDVNNSDESKVSDGKSTQSIRIKDKDKDKESNKPSDKSDKQTDEFSIKKLDNGRYDYPDEYERIYSLYPDNKGTKKSGWRKWAARRREGINQKDLVEAVKNYAKECKRENRDKKYIKHLATFLGPDDHWREYLLKNYTGAGEQNEFSKAGRKEKRENRERKQSKYDQDVVFG